MVLNEDLKKISFSFSIPEFKRSGRRPELIIHMNP